MYKGVDIALHGISDIMCEEITSARNTAAFESAATTCDSLAARVTSQHAVPAAERANGNPEVVVEHQPLGKAILSSESVTLSHGEEGTLHRISYTQIDG